MSLLGGVAVGVVIGLVAGAVLAWRGLLPGAGKRVHAGGTTPPAGNGPGGLDPPGPHVVKLDHQDLLLIRGDIQRVEKLLERVLEEAVGLLQTLANRPGTEETHTPPQRTEWIEPVRDRPNIPPMRPQPAIAPHRGIEERYYEEENRSLDPAVQRLGGEPAWGDPAYDAPVQRGGPPADALKVEAKDDTIVLSERHPPEAWLERSGGDGEVRLNPNVPLSDPALQRWSTFFRWDALVPNRPYESTQPALVSWSGSLGTLKSQGRARPL